MSLVEDNDLFFKIMLKRFNELINRQMETVMAQPIAKAAMKNAPQGVTLGEVATPRISVADIVHMGERLVLPEGMSLSEAKTLITRREEYEAQETVLQETFDCFPMDGAVALDHVLNRRYGWATAVTVPGFFQDNPPQLISVEVGPRKVRQVPWGRFVLPNITGYVETGVQKKGDRFCFRLIARILRRNEATMRELLDDLREEVRTNSIYRGQAIKINFLDDEGDVIEWPEAKFLDTDAVDKDILVLSDHLERAVRTNLFTPITRSQDCLANGIPVKRGVLLGGIYGTGKTLIAHVASRLAVESGITFLYIHKATELGLGIEFARQYQSPACVIFCEDIDREMKGERTEEMDIILNMIDGIDAKTSNIIVVLTTNNIKAINPAMLRPGRLDAVIDVVAPDGPAIERLIHVYAAGALEEGIDLREVGETLAGNIPAVIAEVVRRAKLSQLSLQAPGTRVRELSAEALLDAAKTIRAQVALLNPEVKEPDTRLERVFTDVVRKAINGETTIQH